MEYRNHILCNLPILRKITKCDNSILEACVKQDILDEENVHALKNPDVELQNYNFWSLVMNKTDCWKKIINIFCKSGQWDVVIILIKGRRDDNTDQKYMFINYLKPLKVRVRKQTLLDLRPADDSYNLKPPLIGIALVIKVNGSPTSELYRPGFKNYTSNLCDLWTQFGYRVIQYNGEFTRTRLESVIREFVETVHANEHSMSFIVYIGCHGEKGSLILSDGEDISINEGLLNGLGRKLNAGVLRHKPKFFIVQAPGSINTNQEGGFYNGSNENTMICYLSEPEAVVKLNVNIRNWLLYNLIDVFMREAYIKDLVTLLNEMQTNVTNIFGEETGELIFLQNCGMKTLYFYLRNKEKLEYSNYFLRQTPYLSGICKQQVGDMSDIINDCVNENVFPPEDRENLIKNQDIPTAFWKLVLTKEEYLNIVMDIFYRRNMPNVVDRLKRAKKDDGSENEIYEIIEDMVQKPLKVKLKRPPHPLRNKPNCHNLQEEFIGLAFVINVIEYEKCGLRRHGAEYDTTNMTELWSQMGYKVMRYEGIIKKPDFIEIINKMLQKLEIVNTFCEKKVAQSCVVYIGCHGSGDKLVMSNGDLVDLYQDVVFKFKKLYLQGVPKMFIVQVCQLNGSDMDYGVNKTIEKTLKSMKDLVLCFAARRGKQSTRDSFVGSLYVNAFTNVFMENAYKMELKRMLAEVKSYMKTKFKFHDDTQMPYFEPYNIEDLYFKIKP